MYHFQKHHGSDLIVENHICPICNITCLSKDTLLDHLRTVHHDHAFISHLSKHSFLFLDLYFFNLLFLFCHLLSAIFKIEKKLINSNACPVCGKSYINEGSLRKHITSNHSNALDVSVQATSVSSSSSSSSSTFITCCVCKNVFASETGL